MKKTLIIITILCLLILTACNSKKDCTFECTDKGYNQGSCRSAFMEEADKSVCRGGEANIGHTAGCPDEAVEGMFYSCCCS